MAAIRKACDPTFTMGSTAIVPSAICRGGDCTQFARRPHAEPEGQSRQLRPRASSASGQERPDNATKESSLASANTAKTLVKLVGSISKCYDKCNSNACKGTIPGRLRSARQRCGD